MATVDNYKIKITVDGSEKIVDLTDSLDTLQTTLNRTAAAGIAALAGLATSAIRMADSMVDLSDATGLSVGKIYQLSAALEASGGQFEDADNFIKTFSNTLGQVEKGSKDAIDSLTKLGLSRSEIETLSDEQLFARAVQGLANMEDGFAKTKLATELFGKAAATIDFDKLAEGTRKAVDPELERNLRAAADAVDILQGIFRTLQTAALQALGPILQALSQVEFTAENAKTAVQALGALIAAAFAASVVIQITKIVKLIRDLGTVTKAAAAAQAFLVGLSGVGLATVAASAAAATAAYIALGKAMEGAADEKTRLETGVDTAAPVTGAGRTIGQTPEEKAVVAIRAQTSELIKKNAEANKYQKLVNDTIGMSEYEATLIRTNAELERSAANDKAAIQSQINAELSKGKDTNQSIVTELKKQLQEIDSQLVAQKTLKKEELDRLTNQKNLTLEYQRQGNVEKFNLQVRSQSAKDSLLQDKLRGDLTQRQFDIATQLQDAQTRFEEENIRLAVQRATLGKSITDQEKKDLETLENLNKLRYANEITRIGQLQGIQSQNMIDYQTAVLDSLSKIAQSYTPIQVAQDAVLATWNNMSKSIDTFVETGKFKFSDFARSVISDITKMIAKMLVFKALETGLNAITPGLGTKIFGARAQGGPVKGNTPYIVGEKGPELFVPKSAGDIIPNNKLGATAEMTGRGQISAPITNNYITNNINALDSKSVAQVFAENRKTLLGTVQMAQREMPYG